MTENKTFIGINFTQEQLDTEYYNCTFKNCNFMEIIFPKISLEACLFQSCNLSLCKMSGTSWLKTEFVSCKLTGIQFSGSNRFTFSVRFKDCSMQYASFFGLKIPGIHFSHCNMMEADFRTCSMNKALFEYCELERAVFSETNLKEADFSTARNYTINPTSNVLSKAKFSYEGLPGLLAVFGIEIVN